MRKIILILLLSIVITGCGTSSQKDNSYKPPIYFFEDPLPSIKDLSKEFQQKIPQEDREKAIKFYSEYKNISYQDVEKLLQEKGFITQKWLKLDYKIILNSISSESEDKIITSLKNIINERAKKLGFLDANIYLNEIEGEKHIIVELPNVGYKEELTSTVGKSLSLVIKEQPRNKDTRSMQKIRQKAEITLKKILDGGSFENIGREESLADEGEVTFEDIDWSSSTKVSDAVIRNAILDSQPNTIINQLLEGNNGYTFDGKELVELKGYLLIKSIGKRNNPGSDDTQIRYSQIFYQTSPNQWQSTGITGQYFEGANVIFDSKLKPIVSIKFNSEGSKFFAKITERNINKPLGIFVGGQLITAPNVNEKISGGVAIITGNFTLEEAQSLARDLNTGVLPTPIILISATQIYQ